VYTADPSVNTGLLRNTCPVAVTPFETSRVLTVRYWANPPSVVPLASRATTVTGNGVPAAGVPPGR